MDIFFGPIFWLLITLSVLVTFHELGHYWVARLCGVRVLRFSVGFGKPLWQRTGRDGCQYQIAAIPLGGYVKMLNAREGEVPDGLRAQEFTGQPVWKRIAIVLAGPVFNLVFTITAFWLMFVLGLKGYAPIVTATPDSIAAHAGITPNDRLLRINGTTVNTWSEALNLIGNALPDRQPLPMTIRESDGNQRHLVLPLNKLPPDQDIRHDFHRLGLRPAPPPPIAATVKAGDPAALAGLHDGDRILSINGIRVINFVQMSHIIQAQASQSPALVIRIRRDGKSMRFHVNARQMSVAKNQVRWLIGITALQPQPMIQRYGPLHALDASLRFTWQQTVNVFRLIAQMMSGHASVHNLSGVIGIAQVADRAAHLGLTSFLKFLALISLSLCIMNLLPIPILDGGHLLYYLIELIKGSPVSQRAMIVGQYVGLFLLFALMGLAFYSDIHRILMPT